MHVYKIYLLVMFVAFLIIYDFYCLQRLTSPWLKNAALAGVAFSPWVWEQKDIVYSEFAFLVFLFASLVLLNRLEQEKHFGRKQIILSVVTGVFIYLAYGTRSIGGLLLPSLVAWNLFRWRSIPRSSVVILLVFSVCYLIQSTFLHSDKSYGNIFLLINGQTILKNIETYSLMIAHYWENGWSGIAQLGMIVLTACLAVWGYFGLARERISVGEFFLLFYAGVLIAFPATPANRLLLPLVPLSFLYLFSGAENIRWGSTLVRKKLLPGGLVLLVGLSYLGCYSTLDFSDYSFGIGKKETREMFEFVREKTPASSIIIFVKARVLSLYTGRRVLSHSKFDLPSELWKYFDQIGATHIVVSHASSNLLDKENLLEAVELYEDNLKLTFQNSDFRIFEIEE